MKLWVLLAVLGAYILGGYGSAPFIPRPGALPFFAYFKSRYRGLCSGSVISPIAVLTAAVCVTPPDFNRYDHKPINVVFGTIYRHMRRGIRVAVQKILIPILPNVTGERGYLMQRSPAVLILHKKVPDNFVEVPLRSIPIETGKEYMPKLHDDCFMPGFHFFYRNSKVYEGPKFLLQKRARVQFLSVVKKHVWCGTLSIKFQTLMLNHGYHGVYDAASSVCVKDPERMAQPCHAMYGSPLVCNGRAVGQLSAPDCQWTNCTGMSNLIHLFKGDFIQKFMDCVQKELVDAEFHMDWKHVRSLLYNTDNVEFDYLEHMYDKVLRKPGDESTSSE